MTAISAAKKAANAKWDKENMTIVGCKIKKTEAEAFKEECKRRGTTPNELFRKTIEEFMTK